MYVNIERTYDILYDITFGIEQNIYVYTSCHDVYVNVKIHHHFTSLTPLVEGDFIQLVWYRKFGPGACNESCIEKPSGNM